MRAGIALAFVLLAGCASTPEEIEDVPLKPVARVDLDRYMGRWYMIANIPYFMERGNLAVYVEYHRRPDGLIADDLTARRAFDQPPFTKNGLIEITDTETNAAGLITFLEPIWQDFAILYLDRDYRYTVIGHPTRNYAWIFAREPHMEDAQYARTLDVLEDNGYDLGRVLKIPQDPGQQGAPGYQ